MASVIVPVACDWHAVFSIHDGDTWLGLYCQDCDAEYPPVEEG